MALAAKLQLRQAQSLVMTPQLMQSIRLLQLTHAELQQFIDAEIERNPLLERASGDESVQLLETEPEAPEAREAEPTDPDWFVTDGPPSAEAMAESFDAAMDNVFADDPGRQEPRGLSAAEQWKSSGGQGSAAQSDGEFDIDHFGVGKQSLQQIVSDQIGVTFAEPVERAIAIELAGELDEIGYVRIDLAELAERLDAPLASVEAVLARCQTFDPPGLFARDLAECLSIQLRAAGRLDAPMAALLANLELLARRDFAALKRLCNVEAEALLDMVAEVKRLDPRPGAAFTVGVAEIVVPDVTVRPAADGSWLVELNPETLPRVLVDNAYFHRVAPQVADAAERAFLTDCLQSANWLTRSLDQRAKTILKVASEIVRQQDAFLIHGVRALRPINLKTVADAIGMHESTVSRVTSNKFMMTPRGVFELRYFFTVAIQSAEGGESHSSEAVRDRIRAMIEAESPDAVLSDDTIVDALRGAGVEIARRTVAKYRDALNIPSSVQRRREKQVLHAAGRLPDWGTGLIDKIGPTV